MIAHNTRETTPVVSVILPSYNRANFLRQAVGAIASQSCKDWELIVVDDGSTDGTAELVRGFAGIMPQAVKYVYQENQGPYAARNKGLEFAKGKYVAFYDSDDIWLPHHLNDCAGALEENPDVHWVYGACRVVDLASGRTLSENTFCIDGKVRPFRNLKTRIVGALRIIDDERVIRFHILYGLYCGLQNSVIRRELFRDYRFATHNRNEAEDQVIVVEALARGHRLGYLDNIHVIYNVHQGNSSSAGIDGSLDKQLRIHHAMIAGFQEMQQRTPLNPREKRALRRRLSQEYFWRIGYALLWNSGRAEEAIGMFRRGLELWPWDWRYWKTFTCSVLKSKISSSRPQAGDRGLDGHNSN
jgi:glycosyltransferase involved in cell wall biosynthesis